MAMALATFRFICLFYHHLLCSLSCWLKIVRPQGSRASCGKHCCLFSQLFLATDLICVHACACACMRVRVAPLNSLILFHFICVFASALLSSPSPSLSFPALPHFVASFHNDTLWGGAAQFVCGLYAIFHLDPATPRISLM